MEVLAGRVYKHFKGGYSLVLCVANHYDEDEDMVVYKGLNLRKYYVRPVSSFCQEVFCQSGKKVPRFSLVEDEEASSFLTENDLNMIKLIRQKIN